jgi:hypothetical protein
MKLGKLLLAVVGVTVLLGALVSSASASRLSASEGRLRAIWTRMGITGGFGTINCELTLEGSLHSRSIAKTSGTLIGYITGAAIRNTCGNFQLTVLRETLPWHVTYRSFAGTLPNISGFSTSISGFAMRLRETAFGASCLLLSSAERPVLMTYSRQTATGVLSSATLGGTIPCEPFLLTFEGSSSTLDNGAGSSITVTLI